MIKIIVLVIKMKMIKRVFISIYNNRNKNQKISFINFDNGNNNY